MRRRPTPELLDTDAGTPAEVADSLADLRWFNRWFGGIATVKGMFRTVIERTGQRKLSVLEVAAGEGYVPRSVYHELAQTGVELQFTLLDRALSHLPANGLFPKMAGDALSLPFAEGSFDLVCSSLFLHHLDPVQARLFVRESLRVCRVAALVHDLIRHPVHLAVAYAGLPLYRSRITRNDAPASVRQAYVVEEVKELFTAEGQLEVQKRFFFRMGIIAWKAKRP